MDTLEGVGRVEDAPNLGGKGKERADARPGATPGGHDRRNALPPFSAVECVERGERRHGPRHADHVRRVDRRQRGPHVRPDGVDVLAEARDEDRSGAAQRIVMARPAAVLVEDRPQPLLVAVEETGHDGGLGATQPPRDKLGVVDRVRDLGEGLPGVLGDTAGNPALYGYKILGHTLSLLLCDGATQHTPIWRAVQIRRPASRS